MEQRARSVLQTVQLVQQQPLVPLVTLGIISVALRVRLVLRTAPLAQLLQHVRLVALGTIRVGPVARRVRLIVLRALLSRRVLRARLDTI